MLAALLQKVGAVPPPVPTPTYAAIKDVAKGGQVGHAPPPPERENTIKFYSKNKKIK